MEAKTPPETLDWETEKTPPRPETKFGDWSNVSAEDFMVALHAAGCSVRQVAEMTGFSREWVRRRLKRRGVLDDSRAPTGRVRPGPDGSVKWGFELTVIGLDDGPHWSTTILGIPAIRGMVLALEMFGPDAPKPLRESSPAFRLKGDPRPSIAKLMSPEGWIVTSEECVAALDRWVAAGPDLVSPVQMMSGVLRARGLDFGSRETATRTREFLGLLDILRAGAEGEGVRVD